MTFMKAVLFTGTLACIAMGSDTTFSGEVTIESDGLTKEKVETTTKATLANRLSVPEANVTTTATKSRRLDDGARRLADTWTVAFDIIIGGDTEDFKANARNLRDDSVRLMLFNDVFNQQIHGSASGSSSGTATGVTFSTDITAAVEEEADGAHTLSCNFFLVFVAFMATSAMTK